MGQRESLRSIAGKPAILEDELTRLRQEQSVHVRQLEELDTLKRRADQEKAEKHAAALELLVRCHDLLKMTRSTGVDEVGRLRGDIAAYLEKT